MGLTPPRTSQKHSECVNPENHILSKNKFGIFQDLRIYYAAILYNSFLTYTLRALFIVSVISEIEHILFQRVCCSLYYLAEPLEI